MATSEGLVQSTVICKVAIVVLGMLLGVATSSASDAVPVAASEEAPIVILIGWNGVRHDFLHLAEFPALDRMKQDGAWASRLTPVYPSDTWPGFVSLATGTYPDRHGILADAFVDQKRGTFQHEQSPTADWLLAEPLWVTAENQGVKSAVYAWVGGAKAWRGQAASFHESEVGDNESESTKVKRILGWLDLPEAARPRLIMSWWRGTNELIFRVGPNHPSVAKRIKAHSKVLNKLFKGLTKRELWPRTTVILVSDHGMTEIDGFLSVDDVLAAAKIPAVTEGGPTLQHVYLDESGDLERAYDALSAEPRWIVKRKTDWSDIERLYQDDRFGDITLEAPSGYSLISPGSGLLKAHAFMARLRGWRLGMHGYAPDHPDMGGIFLALGRGVNAGVSLGEVHTVDVAPTIAALLDINPPASSEGQDLTSKLLDQGEEL